MRLLSILPDKERTDMENENQEKQITLSSLFTVLRNSILWILAITVVIATASGLYAKYGVDTEYVAKIDFWIDNFSSNVSSSQTAGAEDIASGYITLSKSDITFGRIKEIDPGIMDMFGASEQKAKVNMIRAISGETSGNTFSIEVSTNSPEKTFALANGIQKVLPGIIREYTSVASDNDKYIQVYTSVDSTDDVREEDASVLKYAVIAAFIAFVLSYAVFFIISYIDNTIYSEEDLKDRVGGPIIGVIPEWSNNLEFNPSRKLINLIKRKKIRRNAYIDKYGVKVSTRNYNNKLISAGAPFAITESFNILRTNLLYSAVNGTPVYGITSAISGAGKSVLICNLAISYANLGKKVLLIEGDMRCSTFRYIFEENIEFGLSELLAGIVEDSHSLMNSFGHENLSVITSGHIPPNPSELLSSEKMKMFIDKWKEEFDVILFDLPPVCEVADSCVMSKFMTGYIFTVRAGYCDYKTVKGAIDILGGVNAHITGFVLNDVPLKGSGYLYHKNYMNNIREEETGK